MCPASVALQNNKNLRPKMKTKFTLLLAVAGLVTVQTASSQEERRQRGNRQMSPELIKKYDKDGDGKLNEEEIKAWREAREKEMLEKYDADKDGKLSDDERKKMEAENPRRGNWQPDAETLKKYDADKDGKLNDDERKAMRDARQKEMLEKYDTDKDGKLSDEESQKARDEWRKQREAQAPKPDAAPKTEEKKAEEPKAEAPKVEVKPAQ